MTIWCPKCGKHEIDPRHGDICPVCAGEASQAVVAWFGGAA